MNDMSWITAALAFIAGGGGIFILNMLRQTKEQVRADKKQDLELKLSETEKAFVIYKEVVIGLKHDVEQLTKSLSELEKQYIETREQKAIVQTKLENTEKEIERLQKTLDKNKAV